jgi:hypothetical protein
MTKRALTWVKETVNLAASVFALAAAVPATLAWAAQHWSGMPSDQRALVALAAGAAGVGLAYSAKILKTSKPEAPMPQPDPAPESPPPPPPPAMHPQAIPLVYVEEEAGDIDLIENEAPGANTLVGGRRTGRVRGERNRLGDPNAAPSGEGGPEEE